MNDARKSCLRWEMKSFELLIGVLKRAVSITSDLPDRSKNDEDHRGYRK